MLLSLNFGDRVVYACFYSETGFSAFVSSWQCTLQCMERIAEMKKRNTLLTGTVAVYDTGMYELKLSLSGAD